MSNSTPRCKKRLARKIQNNRGQMQCPRSQTTASSTNNLQPPGIRATCPVSGSRIGQPVPRRMPCHSRDTGMYTGRGNCVNAITGFRVEDLKTITTTCRLITRTNHKAAVETPAHAANRTAILARECTATDPVRRVPERDEGIATAHREVSARGGECDSKTRRSVRVESMHDVERWVFHDLDLAFARRNENLLLGAFRRRHTP